jgi:hypothetical protein
MVPRMAVSATVPPPFSPAAIEEVCRVPGDAVTGPQIPNLIAPLKMPEEPGGPGTARPVTSHRLPLTSRRLHTTAPDTTGSREMPYYQPVR